MSQTSVHHLTSVINTFLLPSLYLMTCTESLYKTEKKCTGPQGYHRIDAQMADTVIMSCNTTSSSGAEWTRNTTDGHFSYVYFNGSMRGHENILSQYSVVNPSAGNYSLRIYNVHPVDSGLYNCYETDVLYGARLVGYYLVAKGLLVLGKLSLSLIFNQRY